MKPIPTFVHGLIDYTGAVFLLLLPNFYFTHLGLGPSIFARLVAVVLILLSLSTDYELGAVKVVPMKAHLALDFLLSVSLIVAPWLLGFQQEARSNWVPFVAMGIAGVIVASLTTQRTSRYPVWPL